MVTIWVPSMDLTSKVMTSPILCGRPAAVLVEVGAQHLNIQGVLLALATLNAPKRLLVKYESDLDTAVGYYTVPYLGTVGTYVRYLTRYP